MAQVLWTCEECGTEATAADTRLLTAMGWQAKPHGAHGEPSTRLCPVCAKKPLPE